MNSFEDQLRKALRRKAAPEGFAEEVLARAQSRRPTATNPWRRFGILPGRPWRWAVAVAAICIVCLAAGLHHRREERLRREGQLARAQAIQALRIASSKLNVARQKVEVTPRDTPPREL